MPRYAGDQAIIRFIFSFTVNGRTRNRSYFNNPLTDRRARLPHRFLRVRRRFATLDGERESNTRSVGRPCPLHARANGRGFGMADGR